MPATSALAPSERDALATWAWLYNREFTLAEARRLRFARQLVREGHLTEWPVVPRPPLHQRLARGLASQLFGRRQQPVGTSSVRRPESVPLPTRCPAADGSPRDSGLLKPR